MRRWWLVVILGLLFGCVANVGVAWWCHLHSSVEVREDGRRRYNGHPPAEFVNEIPEEWMEPVRTKPGAWSCGWDAYEGFGVNEEVFAIGTINPFGFGSSGQRNVLIRSSAGWPWLALRGDEQRCDDFLKRTATYQKMILLPGQKGGGGVHLPVGIIGLGFIANSAVFGTLGLALWLGSARVVRAWRERRRARRGGCPSCGYRREGLTPDATCPECGQ